MIRSACSLRAHCSKLQVSRVFSTIDFSHEKPAPEQLEHVQKRLAETVPLMFRQRLDYTFYRKDVFCDDQIFQVQKRGLDELMAHLGKISVFGQFSIPHIEMEVISIVPFLDDGTVRCRWRVKYISFHRLLTNYKLFRKEYRLKNLSWFDGYSIFYVDGNGDVSKLTIQRTRNDESKLLKEGSAADKIKSKIAVFRPAPGAVHFAARERQDEKQEK